MNHDDTSLVIVIKDHSSEVAHVTVNRIAPLKLQEYALEVKMHLQGWYPGKCNEVEKRKFLD